MMNRIQTIAEAMKAKIWRQDCIDQIEKQYNLLLAEENDKNLNAYIQTLLQIACIENLLHSLHALLSLDGFKINQSFDHGPYQGQTLLTLAAQLGNNEVVHYLTEVQLAAVNAKDNKGNTPLHAVVYRDYFPFDNENERRNHTKITKYLLKHGADSLLINDEGFSPYDLSKINEPLAIEKKIGTRFITHSGSPTYYADSIRPMLEKTLLTQSEHRELEQRAKPFQQFALEHAVKKYIKNGKGSYGYDYVEDLYKALNALSASDWNHLRRVINAETPQPLGEKFDTIANDMPRIYKQSVKAGLIAAAACYYETNSVLHAFSIGTLSAVFAYHYLTDRAYQQKENELTAKEERFGDMQRHDRFFKPNTAQASPHPTAASHSHQPAGKLTISPTL